MESHMDIANRYAPSKLSSGADNFGLQLLQFSWVSVAKSPAGQACHCRPTSQDHNPCHINYSCINAQDQTKFKRRCEKICSKNCDEACTAMEMEVQIYASNLANRPVPRPPVYNNEWKICETNLEHHPWSEKPNTQNLNE
jgi:hypothetical protein